MCFGISECPQWLSREKYLKVSNQAWFCEELVKVFVFQL